MKSWRRNEPASPSREMRAWQVALQIVLILLGVLLVYWPAVHAGFVWDDELLITGNPLLATFSGLGEIWSFGRTADYYPLTSTIFWVEWHLFGQNAAGFHVLNMLLHAADALLVWLVLRRVGLRGAWLAGLLFALHPVHAESVAWVSELKNVLSMFLVLLSFLCFIEIDDRRILGSTAAYLFALSFFILALLAKAQVAFFPLALLLHAWWRDRPDDSGNAGLRKAMVRLLPFFLVAFLLGLVTVWFQNRGMGEEEIVHGALDRRLVNAGRAVWWYGAHFIAPVRLMAIYPPWRFDSPRWYEWMPLIGILSLLVILWCLRRYPAGRSGFFAASGFVVALAPVLGFVKMSYTRSGTLVADHYQYFADVFLLALLAAGAGFLWARWPRVSRGALAALILSLMIGMGIDTRNRAEVYLNEQTLWEDNLAKNPDAWQAHNRLGQYLFDREDFTGALPHFERAAELKPELAGNHNQLGLVYCRLGRFEEGIAEYRKALDVKEARQSTAGSVGVGTIRANLANALTITANNMSQAPESSNEPPAAQEEAMRRYAEAVAQYEKALEIDPRQPAIHRNLGILLARLGRYPEAIQHLRKVLELAPNEPNARELLDALEKNNR